MLRLLRLAPILFAIACASAQAGSFYGAGSGGGVTAAQAETYGVRLDYVSATTIEIQPGQRIADDGSVLTVSSGFSVTFADIDTGAEASSTGYYVWLTGSASAVLSLSATSPTGVSGGKYLAGWVYNDASSDLEMFRTTVDGDNLRVQWVAERVPVIETGAQPTTFREEDMSTGGYVPDSAKVLEQHLNVHMYSTASATMKLSVDGTETSHVVGLAHVTTVEADTDFAIATQGASFWWKRNSTSGTNKTFVYHRGFTFDRSGVTY